MYRALGMQGWIEKVTFRRCWDGGEVFCRAQVKTAWIGTWAKAFRALFKLSRLVAMVGIETSEHGFLGLTPKNQKAPPFPGAPS